MSDITTDFIKATNKIYAKVAILTNLQVIENDVKLIREQVVDNADKPSPNAQTENSKSGPVSGGTGHTLNAGQTERQERESQNKAKTSLQRLLSKWGKNIKKPRFQVELLAIVGLILYTCETRRTNNLTERSVNLQFSLSRAFLQITDNDFLKNTFEDVQKAWQFYLDIQNVGDHVKTYFYEPGQHFPEPNSPAHSVENHPGVDDE